MTLAAGRALDRLSGGAPLGNVFIVSLLIAGPGFVLLYGGYRLRGSDISPEFYPGVAGWGLAGFGSMVGILALYHLQPEGGISSP